MTAIDLGIALAVVSSYKDQVIDEKTVVFGEVGLSGEVRAVSMAEQRVLEAKKLGFERVILPAVCMKSVEKIGGIALIPVENIQDAILRVGKIRRKLWKKDRRVMRTVFFKKFR